MSGLIYLASPYSHPDQAAREERFRQAARAAGLLMAQGLFVFSPITHTHPIAEAVGLPGDWQFWQAYDREILSRCSRLAVLMLDGWESSRGIAAEVEIAMELGLPVEYLRPDEIAGWGA